MAGSPRHLSPGTALLGTLSRRCMAQPLSRCLVPLGKQPSFSFLRAGKEWTEEGGNAQTELLIISALGTTQVFPSSVSGCHIMTKVGAIES